MLEYLFGRFATQVIHGNADVFQFLGRVRISGECFFRGIVDLLEDRTHVLELLAARLGVLLQLLEIFCAGAQRLCLFAYFLKLSDGLLQRYDEFLGGIGNGVEANGDNT